ncbi:MAG: DUF192 domain-containing protein [Verrucomicrobiota bacterium]
MKSYQVACQDRQILADCRYSGSPLFRMKGLLGRSGLASKEAIWLKPCSQIHMFFMQFPIDAIFLDRVNQVVHIHHSIAPWKVSKWVRRSHSVLECAAGTAAHFGLNIGDPLTFHESDSRI